MVREHNRIILCVFLLLTLFSASCSNTPQSSLKNSAHQYKRILPVSTSVDEIVLALADPEEIAAVTAYARASSNPLILEKTKRIKNTISPNPSTEEILSYKPDCILMPIVFNKAQADTLSEMGFYVVRLELPEGYEAIKERILLIAKSIDKEERGSNLIQKMDERMKTVRSHLKDIPRKKIVVGYSPFGAFGRKGGAFDHICEKAGVINAGSVVNLKRGEHITKEQIIEINPDVILYSASSVNSANVDDVKHDPAFANVRAVKENRVLVIEDRYMSSVTQCFIDSVEVIAKAVYPEEF